MARLIISYSLSYDWLVRGRPEEWRENWREPYESGLAYQAAARAQWEPFDHAVFAAFESFGLAFWQAWPAYPVRLPADARLPFKDPLTFSMTEDWESMRSLIIHELCHVHEDHPANHERYQAVLDHVKATFPEEDESVQFHIITCTLQRAVLMLVFTEGWRGMLENDEDHPVIKRAWELIEDQGGRIDWRNPLASLATIGR